MANVNKSNGTRWETEVVNYLNERGLEARRPGQSERDLGDIHTPEWTIEAKAEKVIDIPGYLKQLAASVRKRGSLPFKASVMVKNRRHSTGEGYAVMSIESYRALMVYVDALEICMENVTGAILRPRMAELKGQLSLFDVRPACQRIGGCLAEIGSSLADPDPKLWRCMCGRSAVEIKAAQS